MQDTQFATSLAELPRFVTCSVVRKNTLHLDAILLVPGNSEQKEFYGRFRRFIRVNGCIYQPGSIIHADMQIFSPRLPAFYLACPGIPMTNPINLSEALYIHMEHIPGTHPLIPLNWRFRLQGDKPGKAQFA